MLEKEIYLELRNLNEPRHHYDWNTMLAERAMWVSEDSCKQLVRCYVNHPGTGSVGLPDITYTGSISQ